MPSPGARYQLNDGVGNPAEWLLTWQIEDDAAFAGRCGFCNKSGIRFTYEVRHDPSARHLRVCSRCIARYPLSGEIDGRRLPPREARIHAHRLTVKLNLKTCRDVIRRVQSTFPSNHLDEIVVYFDRNLQLSPTHAARLFVGIARLQPPVDPGIFNVQTRSIHHQDEFGMLDEASRRTVWPALSPQQRRRLSSLGFAPAGGNGRRHRETQPRHRLAGNAPVQLAGSYKSALADPAAHRIGLKNNSDG